MASAAPTVATDQQSIAQLEHEIAAQGAKAESLVLRYDIRANMVTDAQLAALAIEHGLTVVSTDTDFARFSEIRWLNPLARS